MNRARRTVHNRGLVVLAALIASPRHGVRQRQSARRRGEISGDLKSIKVGSADFPESKIIAEIYAQALEANGFDVSRQFGIGSRETYVPAVKDHSIDLIPEYTGNLLQYFDKNTKATDPDSVLLALYRALPGDLSILTPSPANDQDTVAVTSETAAKWNLKTIGDLAAHSAGGEVRRRRRSSSTAPRGCRGSRRTTAWTSRPPTSSRSATAAARPRCARSSTAR